MFLDKCVEHGDFVTKEDFYLSFKEYCVKKGFRAISKSLVGRRMKELGYEEIYKRKEPEGKQYRSWIGIEVKSEYLVEEEQEEKLAEEFFDEAFEKELEKGV